MTAPADLLLTGGHLYPLTEANEPVEAVAVRDGRVVRLGSTAEMEFLNGVETAVIDLGGRTVLPGFVDAHTHMEIVGRHEREADLTDATTPEECLDRLIELRDRSENWILGFGYDESNWGGEYLTRDQLDEVSDQRPVVAYREDLHVASVNSVVLDRYLGEFPDGQYHTSGGEPTGVLVEDALDVIRAETRAGPEKMREYLLAAQQYALEHGVTAVHDMVRHSHAPRIYRELDNEGTLGCRVRLNYWRDHLDAVEELGLRTNHGSDRVQIGGIKTFVDGSIGARTAKLSTPYADMPGETGEWVLEPDELQSLVERVDDAGLQMTVHAIGDEAISTVLDAYEGTDGERHRIEHAELLTDELIDRFAQTDVILSGQPNFLKWAGEDGLYADRLGDQRRRDSNRFGTVHEREMPLAFGSDCMPLDPLFGIEHVVDAPVPAQQLSVTDALRAYTRGGAYAGFDEDRMGTIEPGNCADFVVLAESPWETDQIAAIDVEMTIVGGEVVHDSRDS